MKMKSLIETIGTSFAACRSFSSFGLFGDRLGLHPGFSELPTTTRILISFRSVVDRSSPALYRCPVQIARERTNLSGVAQLVRD